jgi:hypothetical protein
LTLDRARCGSLRCANASTFASFAERTWFSRVTRAGSVARGVGHDGLRGLADAAAARSPRASGPDFILPGRARHAEGREVQDAAARNVRVRSHVDEKAASRVSVILLHVEGSAVYLSASGYLVRPDGTMHHALISELASLHRALQKKLEGAGAGPSSTPPSAAVGAPGALPVAWTESASDGGGTLTCLPVKLTDEEQTQLSLKLANGETADVSLSLAPGLCRSPTSCKLPGGCPALGIADSDRVSRLAARLSKHEVTPLATLFSHGQPIVVIDLSKHGSIAQAMAEKH